MQNIKVLVVSDYRETTAVRPEAEAFIGLKQQGIVVEIMTYGEAEYAARFRQAGIRVIDFHPRKKFDRGEMLRIREELVRGGHHILHLFNSQAIINGIRAARKLPVKVVLYRGLAGNIHWYDPTAYLKFLHPRVDKIVGVSQATEEHFHRQLFFDKRKTVVIHKGHDPAWYSNVQPLNSTELVPDRGAFLVGCVANARRMKGIRFLLEATRFLPSQLPIHLLLVGNNMDDTLHLKLRELSPNRHKIHLLGFRQDPLPLVAACHAFVLPSIQGEAITKAVVEAMSLGIAPVITALPGNRELVIDGQCGLVVPPRHPQALAQAILKLYHDRELCRQYGQAAKKHVQTHFHLHETVVKTKQLYEALLMK